MPANYTNSATATASGAGTASVTFQAPNVGARGLRIVSVALTVTPSTQIPQAAAYRDQATPPNLLARKLNGAAGTFIGEGDVLYMGQRLVIVWTGASSGASCTATLRGEPA